MNWLKKLFGFPIPLTEDQKDSLIRRIKAEREPGSVIPVSSDELKWIGTTEYNLHIQGTTLRRST